jgi:hypothetical protein
MHSKDIKEEWRDDKCKKKIMDIIQNTKKELSAAFGQSLHDLEVSGLNENAVEKVYCLYEDIRQRRRLSVISSVHEFYIWVMLQGHLH